MTASTGRPYSKLGDETVWLDKQQNIQSSDLQPSKCSNLKQEPSFEEKKLSNDKQFWWLIKTSSFFTKL